MVFESWGDALGPGIVSGAITSIFLTAVFFILNRNKRQKNIERELWLIYHHLRMGIANSEYSLYYLAINNISNIIEHIIKLEEFDSKYNSIRDISHSCFRFRQTVLYDIYRRCEGILTWEAGYSGDDELKSRCEHILDVFSFDQSGEKSIYCTLLKILLGSYRGNNLRSSIDHELVGLDAHQKSDLIKNAISSDHCSNRTSVDEYWKKDMFTYTKYREFIEEILHTET